MTLFHNLTLTGATPLHTSTSSQHVPSSPKSPRKAQSHASSLSPLVRLVTHPVASLETAVESLWVPTDDNAAQRVELDHDARRQVLLQRLNDAVNLDTWRTAAEELDEIEGNNAWKADPCSPLYDYQVLYGRLSELENAQLSRDPARMLFLLRNFLTRTLGNMGDLHLYKYSHVGTKHLIEKYIDAVCDTFDVFLSCFDKATPSLDPKLVYEEFLRCRQYFGRSALLLSGGGTFGMAHTGVVKCLWENDLLPRIISGSSAGSIVASVVCVKTDEELPKALEDFCSGDMEVFEREGEKGLMHKATRMLTTRTVFDVQNLVRVMKGWLGDMTFLEAYNRTRRILNVAVSSTSMNELPRLLNYVSAPNVIIWSAVVASCSVPLVFSPTTLMSKDPHTGRQCPWNPSQQYMDGSVDNDLPMTRLAEMFNVNHFIVSQVNPHVTPFLQSDEVKSGRNGIQPPDQTLAENPSAWDTLGNIAKGEILHRMHMLSEVGVFPTTLTKFCSVMSQKYSGHITILPQISFSMIPRVLQNPDPDFMERALLCGQRATWPKLSRIQNHLAIELAIDKAISKLVNRMAFSPSQVNLRMMSMTSSKHSERDRRRDARLFNHSHRNKSKSLYTNISTTHASRLSSHLQLHPKPELHQKLEAASLVQSRSPVSTSGSESDEEDNADDGFLLNLSSRRRKRALETSSPEPIYDSSTSHALRSQSPSPAGSPDPVTSAAPPKLWPVGGRLAASQPATPFVWQRRRSSPEMLTPTLTMTMSMPEQAPETPKPMSEAERKYKRAFHEGTLRIVPSSDLPLDVSGTRGMVLRKKLSRGE